MYRLSYNNVKKYVSQATMQTFVTIKINHIYALVQYHMLS